jgi:hypothetical protein
MRYGGKKMADIELLDGRYIFIKDDELFGFLEGLTYHLSGEDGCYLDRFIDVGSILGSWVEVK